MENDDSPLEMTFKCPKCSGTGSELGEFRAASGFWSKIFDVQSAKFTTVTCSNCKYTEVYKRESNMGGNILDFFTN